MQEDVILSDFHSRGYCIIRGFMPPDEVSALSSAFDDLYHVQANQILTEQRVQVLAALAEATDAEHARPIAICYSARGAKYTYALRPGVSLQSLIEEPDAMRVPTTISVVHIANAGLDDASGTLERAGSDRRMLSLASLLLDRDALQRAVGFPRQDSPHIIQIINQAHFKSPGDGVDFPWHQDSKFRRFAWGDFVDLNGWGSYVNISVSIDPSHRANGSLGFLPTSHHAGHLGDKDGLDPSSVDTSSAEYPELQPGDAIAIGPFVIHGSEANTSPTGEWRRTFINGFAFPGAIQCEARKDVPSMNRFVRREVE